MHKGKNLFGPVYRTNLIFTAEDFERAQGGQQNQQPGGGGGGQGSQNQIQNQNPPSEETVGGDTEIEVVRDDGTIAGVIPPKGRTPQQQQQPQNQGGPGLLDQVLEGDEVPEAMRNKTVREMLGAMNALANINRMGQPQQQQVQQPQALPEVQFTDEDFGITADPKKFQAKLTQMMQQNMAQMVSPMVVQNYTTAAQVAATNARNSLPYYNLFKDEIEAVMLQQRIDVAANPQAWQTVHDRLVTQNMNKVIRHEATKNPPKPQPGNMARGGASTSAPQQGKKAQISEEEWRIINSTGVTPQEYVFYRDNY